MILIVNWTFLGPSSVLRNLPKVIVLYAGVGFVKRVTVECVEQLPAEVQPDSLGEGNGFVDAEVLVIEREAADVGRVTRHIAEYIRDIGTADSDLGR